MATDYLVSARSFIRLFTNLRLGMATHTSRVVKCTARRRATYGQLYFIHNKVLQRRSCASSERVLRAFAEPHIATVSCWLFAKCCPQALYGLLATHSPSKATALPSQLLSGVTRVKADGDFIVHIATSPCGAAM